MPLSKLNPEQYAAATAPAGHSLVIASAGTGKTSTIVARIANLLNNGIKPERILLLTFTNKAATEMIERLERSFPKRITSAITAGTFHSVSYKLLQSLGTKVALKQPSELKTLLKSVIEQRKFHHLSDTKPYSGAYLYELYSLYQNGGANDSFSSWLSAKNDEHAIFADIYEDVLAEFEREKENFGYVDFNDLLLKAREHLKNGEVSFDEVLVDEYQDTNTLQGSLIDAIQTKSLFCVGDFDQSIYAFNGANIDIIGSFSTRYEDAKIYALNINYRSSASILALANKVISNNPRLYEKKLIVNREGSFKPPRLLVYNELIDQYAAIADMIALSAYAHSDIAIIFRNNSSADGLEIALKERGISARRKGSMSFFESREVKAITDILSLIVNPKDIMAFIHICEYAKGVGSALAKEIFEAALKLGHGSLVKGFLSPDTSVNIAKNKRHNYELGLFDHLDDFAPANRFETLSIDDKFKKNPILSLGRINEHSAKFLNEIYAFLASPRPLSAKSGIDAVKNSKLFSAIAGALADKRATLKNGNIDLERRAQAYDKIYAKATLLSEIAQKYRDVESFFNFMTLGASELSEGEGVNLLSVHASKGLEFGKVFVVDLAQGRFPNFKLMAQGGNLEEERRLFYVAVTRAKDELYLSYARQDKIKNTSYQPSCFLVEAGMAQEG
ncbi:ATP-dependent helicase [Campylobacter sp. 19-13652]|uniref:ATP-dependent helicase n=1 Tax=Campylobacter sp. 19-13652 TaxID=2840180 RepID=UPI001C79057C|nr:ATP-dependent helicase [Campylobacter sp. 19-13652]BCX79451.1 DNA helicase [Campylobacter sp. 19-13652]